MKATSMVFLGLLAVASNALATGGPDTLWTRTFGGAGQDICFSIAPTSDGGYVLAGLTTSFGAGDENGWMVKTDGKGDSLWSRTFGGSLNDWYRSVQQTSDGGYISAGQTQSFGVDGCDFWLVKTGANGDSLWSRTFGRSGDDRCFAAQQTLDGGYILAGLTSTCVNPSSSHDGWLLETNITGDSLWSRCFGGGGLDEFASLALTSDGGYILAGRTFSWGSGGSDMWLVKTDAHGDSLWSRTYGGTGDEDCRSVRQTSDGGYILAGETRTFAGGNPHFWLVKTNANGDSLWSRCFVGRAWDGCHWVHQTQDGGYILAGWADNLAADPTFWLVKTDSNGTEEWNRFYGDNCWDCGERCYSAALTAEGGYVLAGQRGPIWTGSIDSWLVKTAPDLCSMASLTGTLHANYSPYDIYCDLLVAPGDTLVIEPGVVLNFMGPYKFEVRGTLLAEGTEEDSIVFTTDTISNPDRWRGLRFESTGSFQSQLSYCVVERTTDFSGVRCYESSPTFTNCIMRDNSGIDGGGVYLAYSTALFTNCVIQDNLAIGSGGGVCCSYSSAPTFAGCALSGNSSPYGGGIRCYSNASPAFTNCVISGNIGSNAGGGVNSENSSPTLTNCIIDDNASDHGGAAYVHSSAGAFVNCTLFGNSTTHGAGGVYFDSSSSTFNSNFVAFSTGIGVFFKNSSGSQIRYCDIFGNTWGDVRFYSDLPSHGPPGIGQIITTNRNGDSCDVFHNIFLDPRFVNSGAGDYHLRSNSPCIDAGDPELPLDLDCTPADIGAFYFFHLAQPESLTVQQEGNDMLLHWTVVDSTECAYPTPIRSYVIYYEQNYAESWDFLAAVTDTTYRHRNVVLFAPRMYYEVVATDVEIETINRVARSGMSREEFLAALRRIEH